MPRYVINDSEEEIMEPKSGRRTRTALAASAVDSSTRRSTRNRQSPVNPDGSSPESVTNSTGSLVTRVTRRRGAAAAETVAAAVADTPRVLRSRRNSVSSNISEQLESESGVSTPKTRSSKQNSVADRSPDTPKPTVRTRRSMRAASETKSPPPVGRVTRRTRANSITSESNTEHGNKGAAAIALLATPTKRRRTQVSVLPSEPVLTEEVNEEKVDTKIYESPKITEEEIAELNSSPNENLKKSPRRSSPVIHKSAYDDVKADKSPDDKPLEKNSTTPLSSPQNKSEDEKVDKHELIGQSQRSEDSDIFPIHENLFKSVQSSPIKAKHNTLDKSKELGMKIEDLLNKSKEEQEKSPGNKENEKLNMSHEKLRKNLDYTVSNVNVIRGKSLGSSLFINKSDKKKINVSLDEQDLSKSRSDVTGPKPIETEDIKLRNTPPSIQLHNLRDKSQQNLSFDIKSPEKNYNKSASHEQTSKSVEEHNVTETKESKLSSPMTEVIKPDDNIAENEVTEEFTLRDSDSSHSDDSRRDLQLAVENSDSEESSNSSRLFDQLRKMKGKNITDLTREIGKKQLSLTLERVDNICKTNLNTSEEKAECDNDEDSQIMVNRKRKSTEKEETSNQADQSRRTSIFSKNEQTNNPAIDISAEKNSKEDINEEELLDANKRNKTTIHSPDKTSVTVKDDECEPSQNEPNNQISDSESNVTVDYFFQDISADEWNKAQKHHNLLENQSKEKVSPKIKRKLEKSNNEIDSEEDLEFTEEKSCNKTKKKTKNCDNSFESDETVTFNKNEHAKGSDKKRQSVDKTICEMEESDIKETPVSRKSLNKSVNSNKSMKNETMEQMEGEDNQNSVISLHEEEMQVDGDISEAENISMDVMEQNPETLTEANSGNEENEQEKQPKSPRKNKKNKEENSPVKSATKTSANLKNVYDFKASSEDEASNEESDGNSDDKKMKTLITPRSKSLKDKKSNEPVTPMRNNYSTVAVVDSDSGSENITDPDCPSSDNSNNALPDFLFNIESSSNESDTDSMKNNTNKSMNSDIAKEMNLAGDEDIEYSDDNLKGDECRASESEHSDEDDAGSDLGDFVVADDAVESSEYSDVDVQEKESIRSKFKRILDKSSSEDEIAVEEYVEDEKDKNEKQDEHQEELEKSEEEGEKDKESIVEEDEENAEEKVEEGEEDDEEEEIEDGKEYEEQEVEENENNKEAIEEGKENEEEEAEKSSKKLKVSGAIKSLMNTTIDLCTPEQNELDENEDGNVTQSSVSNTSLNSKSAKKLRKKLAESLETSTPIKSNLTKDKDEFSTPKTKTPNKDTKDSKENTATAVKKGQRDSLQIIRECKIVKNGNTRLNKSMHTPNSETPVTKFLKKERLNESLPLLEQNKKVKKKKSLNKMQEDKSKDDTCKDDDQNEFVTDFDYENKNATEDVEEESNEVKDDDHWEKEEEENVEMATKEKDSSKEEIDVKKKKKKLNKKATKQPEITTLGKKQKVGKSEVSITSNESKISTSDVVNESNEENVTENKKRQLSSSLTGITPKKKRAKLESTDTIQSLKNDKKTKKASKLDKFHQDDSDSDEAPESVGFSEARTEALQAIKDVASSLKAAKEAKKKKRREQLERIRQEKEAKLAKKLPYQEKTKSKIAKTNLKRLPDDILENLSDVPERPKKKLKLSKKEEQILPSRYQFSPNKLTKSSIKVKNRVGSLSTVGGTTQFSVENLEKVEKRKSKAVAVVSFREKMLARNPRQPISAFLAYQAKQKASGKQLHGSKRK